MAILIPIGYNISRDVVTVLRTDFDSNSVGY